MPAAESGEIAVDSDDLCVVLDRQGREVRVSGEIQPCRPTSPGPRSTAR